MFYKEKLDLYFQLSKILLIKQKDYFDVSVAWKNSLLVLSILKYI